MIASFLSNEPWLAAGLTALLCFLAAGYFRERYLKRRLAKEGVRYREHIYREFHLIMWPLAALCMAAWLLSGRSIEALGFAATKGWGWIGAWGAAFLIGLHLLWSLAQTYLSEDARASLRKQIKGAGDLDLITPTTPRQHVRFYGVSLAAGVTEEIMFRGFMIGALAVFLPAPAAAFLALALFILGHSYQGLRGMVRIFPISFVLTLMFVLSGSLWPGIVLHTLVDAAGGAIIYQALREGRPAPAADGAPA